MATYTTNLNLIKPDINDPVSPKPFNENADILDEKISTIASGLGNKWELIKSYNFSVSGNKPSILIPKSDTYDYYPYDELLLCFANTDINTTATGCYAGISFMGPNARTTLRLFHSNKVGYAKYPDTMFTFKRYMCDPIDKIKYYHMDIDSLEHETVTVGNGIEYDLYTTLDFHPVISKNVDLYIKVLNCTFAGVAKVYGRVWVLPGD